MSNVIPFGPRVKAARPPQAPRPDVQGPADALLFVAPNVPAELEYEVGRHTAFIYMLYFSRPNCSDEQRAAARHLATALLPASSSIGVFDLTTYIDEFAVDLIKATPWFVALNEVTRATDAAIQLSNETN